ncbi:MAG: hypothetical protein R6X31_05760 [Anaerolineae bacterium]
MDVRGDGPAVIVEQAAAKIERAIAASRALDAAKAEVEMAGPSIFPASCSVSVSIEAVYEICKSTLRVIGRNL